jgi:hypothetical protein
MAYGPKLNVRGLYSEVLHSQIGVVGEKPPCPCTGSKSIVAERDYEGRGSDLVKTSQKSRRSIRPPVRTRPTKVWHSPGCPPPRDSFRNVVAQPNTASGKVSKYPCKRRHQAMPNGGHRESVKPPVVPAKRG